MTTTMVAPSRDPVQGALDELRAYSASAFDPASVHARRSYPLADEPFVAAWERWARDADTEGAATTLRRALVQLQFPVVPGMSGCADYQACTRRGIRPPDGTYAPAHLSDPEGLSIGIHPTPAGRLPVITARSRGDFETIVRAVTRRNELDTIPASMGACIVGGYNNWARVDALRTAWTARQQGTGGEVDGASWTEEFRRIMPERELYQDRFVILSSGPYSGTRGADVGVDDVEWLHLSYQIRLEHECAHYFTRRVFGSMRNSLLDELVADYAGIVAVRGRFEPAWLLRFMGVEGDGCRPDGRLVNYRGTPPLGDDAFLMLQQRVRSAARTLDEFDTMLRGGPAPRRAARTLDERAWSISAIAGLGLETLTEPGAGRALYAAYRRCADAPGS